MNYIKKIDKKFLIYAIIVGGLIFSLTLYRTITTCITYDEAFTYMNYVPSNPFEVFRSLFVKGAWANNHILNSFLISVVQLIPNSKFSELAIRVPNLLFFVIYIIYSYLISKKLKNKYLCFSLLLFNYGVCEFFGLARGYGISCSLVLVGLYYLMTFFEKKKIDFMLLSFFFLILACYANTVSLIIFAAVLCSTFIFILKNKMLLEILKKRFYIVIPLIVLTLLIIRYHFYVSSDGLPLYGGTEGFIKNVLISSMATFGFTKYVIHAAIFFFFGFILLYDNKFSKCKKDFIIPLMPIYLVLLILVTVLTKNMWLTGRCLIPVWPVFALSFSKLFDALLPKKWLIIFSIFCIIICGGCFIKNINVKQTRDWADNYVIKDKAFMAYHNKDCQIIEPYKFNETTNFYRQAINYDHGYDIYCQSIQ